MSARLPYGTILHIGEEPSGASWTGFQSVTDAGHGYLIVYRENTPSCKEQLKTWLPEGKRISIKPILGDGRKSTIKVGTDGLVKLKIRRPNSFVIYEYSVKQ